MDSIDRQLLNILQMDFPLVTEPFAVIAERLGIDEDEVISRVRMLKEQGIIRQISAIFDSASLGYKSLLAALKVDKDNIDRAAKIVNAHSGVSHNYERDHEYNLWFTITVRPGESPEEEVDRLATAANAIDVRKFPTIQVFKIGVAFDMTGDNRGSGFKGRTSGKHQPRVLSDEEIETVRALQHDLPLEHKPFAKLARGTGLSDEDMIEQARAFLEQGVMRRYAAVLRHREAGFSANAMAVWQVPEDRVDEVGEKMAAHPAVSHCYRRPTYPDWPYTIFTMIHGRSPKECEKAAKELSEMTGISDYRLLYSTREFKKTRVRYYESGDTSD